MLYLFFPSFKQVGGSKLLIPNRNSQDRVHQHLKLIVTPTNESLKLRGGEMTNKKSHIISSISISKFHDFSFVSFVKVNSPQGDQEYLCICFEKSLGFLWRFIWCDTLQRIGWLNKTSPNIADFSGIWEGELWSNSQGVLGNLKEKLLNQTSKTSWRFNMFQCLGRFFQMNLKPQFLLL